MQIIAGIVILLLAVYAILEMALYVVRWLFGSK